MVLTSFIPRPTWLFLGTAILAFLGLTYLGILISDSALDIAIHDTYFVVGLDHVGMWVGSMLLFFAICYWIYPIVVKRHLNDRLGVAHFVLTAIGIAGVFWALRSSSLVAPRRYYSYEQFDAEELAFGISPMAMLIIGPLVLGQLIFLYNLISSLFKPREA